MQQYFKEILDEYEKTYLNTAGGHAEGEEKKESEDMSVNWYLNAHCTVYWSIKRIYFIKHIYTFYMILYIIRWKLFKVLLKL